MPPLSALCRDRAVEFAAAVGLALIAALPFAASGQDGRPAPTVGTSATAPEPVFGLMGRRIMAAEGAEIGRVVDLVVDAEGRPRAAVVDVGGFLGIGSRRVALAWRRLAFRGDEGAPRIVTDVPADRLSAAPEYRPGEATSVFDPGEEG
jgi:hypothetical protein